MFYKLIEKKCNEWLASDECTIKELLQYIMQRGMMRDAQMEAIKTYLFLKIACKNQPLWRLFVDGVFNDTNIGQVELTETARQIFSTNKAAVALFQYSRLHDKKGKQLAPELEHYIKQYADEIDYEATFQKIFYGVTYTDYLFSLPMGAGKTYLMAAFIYLDLYFAQNEPNNPDKGLEFKKCKTLLLEALEDHQSLSREEIDRLWWNLLPDALSDKQKKAKVGNMLTKIREEDVIINKTQGNSSMWSLVKSKR